MKKYLFLLFSASSSFAAAPVITPSVPVVYVGSCTTFVADQAAGFSLGSGSSGTITQIGTSSATYCAPKSLTPHNNFLGCQDLPDDHVYNTRVDSLPIDKKLTDALHTGLSAAGIKWETDMPENRYTTTTSSTNLILHSTPQNNGYYRLLGFPDMRVENGFFTDTRKVDQHIIGMTTDICQGSEVYGLWKIGDNPTGDCSTCNAGSAQVYNDSYTLVQGPDAAGMYVGPLMLKYSELAACRDRGIPIRHALRFTLSNGLICGSSTGGACDGNAAGTRHIWPATAEAFTGGGTIPYGARYRLLASSVPVSGSKGAQCVLNALEQYGMFLADGGQNIGVPTFSDAMGDYDLFQVLKSSLPAFNNFNSDSFVGVDESLLMDSVTTSPTYLSGRVRPDNPYVLPDHFATVIASNAAVQFSSTAIILQPVTVGVSQATGLNFMANSPMQQLPVWVQGSTDTAITCTTTTITSLTGGTLTVSGIYTPPVSVTTRSSATVTCASRIDPTQSISFPIVVFSSSGIRERLANASNTDYGPDVNGNTWYADSQANWRLPGTASCDWRGDTWSGTDVALNEQCQFYTSDYFYRAFVSNRVYKLSLKYGFGVGNVTPNLWEWGIDTQGSIYSQNPTSTTVVGTGPWAELGITGYWTDECTLLGGCLADTPGTITLNTPRVTGTNMYFANRAIRNNDSTSPFNVLSAFSIEPVADPSPILTLTDSGPGSTETITVISSAGATGGVFKLVFATTQNWGMSDWYDLVNDTAAKTNLILAYGVSGPSAPCSAQNSLTNITYYGNNDYSQFLTNTGPGCTFPNAGRSMTIIRNGPSLVELQATGHPLGGTTLDSNTVTTTTWYIYPNGQIFVHQNLAVTTAYDFTVGGTVQNYAMQMSLNNPVFNGSSPPDSGVGWIRASKSQNPYNHVTNLDTYLYVYWDPTTPTYGLFTRASAMLVPSPNNNVNLLTNPLVHGWSCGVGCGTERWGYTTNPSASGPWNMGANSSISWDWLIQLGTQGSSILPNLNGNAVTDPIANAYIANPNPSIPASGAQPVTIQGGATILGGTTIP